MAFRLQLGESVSDGIRRLILGEISFITDQLSNQSIEWDIGVHEARKSCKRVRALLRLVRQEIGVELFKQENIRFRDTAQKLAAVRDSKVMIDVLDRLTTNHVGKEPVGAFEVFRNRLVQDYEATILRERADIDLIPGIMETMKDAADQIENLPIKREGFSALHGGIKRTYGRCRYGMERSAVNPIPENHHEWRKRVKYLWHQVEILIDIKPEVLIRLAEELHTLADSLGDHHDLVVLQGEIQDSPESFTDRFEQKVLMDLCEQRRLDLEAQAQRLGELDFYLPTEDFCCAMERYWQVWRSEE